MKDGYQKMELKAPKVELAYLLVMEGFFILATKEWKIDQSWGWMDMEDKLY